MQSDLHHFTVLIYVVTVVGFTFLSLSGALFWIPQEFRLVRLPEEETNKLKASELKARAVVMRNMNHQWLVGISLGTSWLVGGFKYVYEMCIICVWDVYNMCIVLFLFQPYNSDDCLGWLWHIFADGLKPPKWEMMSGWWLSRYQKESHATIWLWLT